MPTVWCHALGAQEAQRTEIPSLETLNVHIGGGSRERSCGKQESMLSREFWGVQGFCLFV